MNTRRENIPLFTSNRFLNKQTNSSPKLIMKHQERVDKFGKNYYENSFKRTVRVSPPAASNFVMCNSISILSNIPNSISHTFASLGGNSINSTNTTNSTNNNNGKFALRTLSKNVDDLFFNYKSNLLSPKWTSSASVFHNEKISDIKKDFDIHGIFDKNTNNSLPKKFNTTGQIATPTPSPFHRTPCEYFDKMSSEYFVKNASCVKEFAYKEEQNAKYKDSMEDTGKAIDKFNMDPDQGLFCLYDGHGGPQVAQLAKNRLPQIFEKMCNNNNVNNHTSKENLINFDSLFTMTFSKMDDELKLACNNYSNVGSTASVVFITKENDPATGPKKVIYCANIGDTRCCMITCYGAKRLSYDDRASDKNEFTRITNSGGIIYGGRVYGQLMLSRSFGDFALKAYGVIAVPHVSKYYIMDKDRYLIIASDGIWDVFSDEDIFRMSNSVGNSEEYVKCIVKNALIRGTLDNISCFVLKIN